MLAAATTRGAVVAFDYKTLHRGPANRDDEEGDGGAADGGARNRSRPMISMVFSKLFFLNNEAFVNRGVGLAQSLHQRRYWESFVWHPPTTESQFVV